MQSRHKRRSFKFENWWLKKERVADEVHDSWITVNQQSIIGKISDCIADLECWNRLHIRKNIKEKDLLCATRELFQRSNEPVVVDQYMEAHNDYKKMAS